MWFGSVLLNVTTTCAIQVDERKLFVAARFDRPARDCALNWRPRIRKLLTASSFGEPAGAHRQRYRRFVIVDLGLDAAGMIVDRSVYERILEQLVVVLVAAGPGA